MILVHHFGEIVSQLFEVYLAKLQIQIMREQTFNHGPDCFRIDTRLEEVEINYVLPQPVHASTDNVEERVDHLRLEVRVDPSDHAEIEKRDMTAIHHQQVSGMWIRVKKAVFKQLL